MINLETKKRNIIEITAAGISLENKHAIRGGPSLASKQNKMLKHLDSLFLMNLISGKLYLEICIKSIPMMIELTKVYLAENMTSYLGGVLTNVKAFDIEDMSIQRTNVEDREIISLISTRQTESYISFFRNHIGNMTKLRRQLKLVGESLKT